MKTETPTATDFSGLPVSTLKGIGPKTAIKLERLGIRSVQDALFHLPFRYQDRTRVTALGSLRAGAEAVIEGEVELAEVRFGRRRSLLVRLSDGTGALTLRFFHFSNLQKQSLARGIRLRCFGEVRRGAATLEMIHPEYELISGDAGLAVEDSLTAIYPATDGVHQLTLRNLSDRALAALAASPGQLPEWLPTSLRKQLRLPDLATALQTVHRPPQDADTRALENGRHPCQRRLALEELMAHHLSLRKLRERASRYDAPALGGPSPLNEKFIESLPFQLTGAQQQVVAEIDADLAQAHPMQRLVQGDVGSGKTVVAACAALRAINRGFQTAIMAPTELLAEQHLNCFRNWFEPLGIPVAWLSGRARGPARKALLDQLADGSCPILVGTHALFQDDVLFKQLGLVIIDEQHRFGVHQRLALRNKGRTGTTHPHQLIMTATPIPRTMAMSVYADLDVSVIDELPPGRTPVQTAVVPDTRRMEVIQRVHTACRKKQQVYWVCTLIDESEVLQCQAASDTATELTDALSDLRIGLVHGRLKPAEKEAVMHAFKQGDLDLLVATTVIEVGVDVPNASLMVIENAERLGLAQLHQLRGRVGRGTQKSTCVLMYRGRLSQTARTRLAVMRETSDGFEIARRDLEQRGPGEVLGTRQTGEMRFHIADLVRDQDLLANVERGARQILRQHPDSVEPLIRRWLKDKPRYAEA